MKLPKNLKPLVPPYGQYQIDSIGFGVLKDNTGILLGLGLGKTYVSINICRWRIQNNNVKKILVVCPTSILLKWKAEIHKFSEYDAVVLHSENRQARIQKIKNFIKSGSHFGLINYEALSPFYKYLSKIPLDMVIADESARYISNAYTSKNGRIEKVKRTDTIFLLGDKARYRNILTGTLISNKPMGLWSQFRFLDKGETFGLNFYAWRSHFFEKKEYYNYSTWDIKKSRIKDLNNRIYENCITFKTKDIPDENFILVNMEMNKELLKIYNTVKTKILSEIEVESGKAVINIKHIFTKLIRLQQITSGYIKDDSGKLNKLKHTPKLDAVKEEVETIMDNNESVIIWCKFRYTIELLSKMLKTLKPIVMTGDDKHKIKSAKIKEFQTSKTKNVFIGQIVAGGIGIELFKINSEYEYQHMIFVENTFVLDHRQQAIGRSYGRIGQKSKVRIIDFIFKDSIDDRIYNTIMQNKIIADEILKTSVRGFLE